MQNKRRQALAERVLKTADDYKILPVNTRLLGRSKFEFDEIKKHPAVAVRQDALSTLVRVGSLLGLDPTSYRRLMGGGGGGDPEGDNEFRTF